MVLRYCWEPYLGFPVESELLNDELREFIIGQFFLLS
jgi:hypothetical protein